MKVFIITEGSEDIGFGHITRCLSLYQAFEEKGILPVFVVNGDETVKDLLRDKNYEIFNWLEKEEKLLDFVQDADVVIIDSYLADYELYETISKLVKIPVYIDDNKRIEYPGGIVVNGTIYAEELNYPQKIDVTYLLGSQYISLREEFRDVPEKEIRKSIETVMITFGGDDMRNMTPRVLKLFNENFPGLSKKVVIGKGFRNIKKIENLSDFKTQLIYYPDAEGMKEVMLEADIAISAGGQTLYELARVGVPTIAIAVAGNQMNNIKGWQRAGFIEYAGWWEDKDVLDNIMQKIALLGDYDLRMHNSQTVRATIDGRGAPRIIQKCVQAFFKDSVILRLAETEDLYDVYKLSHTKDIRSVSFQQEKITLKSHKKWFNQKICDKSCLFLIGEIDNAFLGQVRLDMDGKEAVISISLVKKFRGLGIGEVVMDKAINFVKLHYPVIRIINAFVKQENTASIKFFREAGFKFNKNLIIKNQNAVKFQYEIKD